MNIERRVRISASCLVNFDLSLDGERLWVLARHIASENIGIKTYAPVGGVYMFNAEGKQHWEERGAEFEESFNMRMKIKSPDLEYFSEWFKQRIGRERTPDREVREELVQQVRVFDEFNEDAVLKKKLRKTYIERNRETRRINSRRSDIRTTRFFEVWDLTLRDNYRRQMRDFASREESKLILATEEEIRRLRTERGETISDHSKYLLNPQIFS